MFVYIIINMKKGKLIIFVGPSGVGKATIEKKIFLKKKLNIEFSISATTRKPRPNEKNNVDYYFITKEQFIEKISNNEFLEWSNHLDLYYGTLKSEIERITKNKKHAFLEIETNGAIEVFNKIPKKDIISIFLMPPSMKALEDRIRKRNTESNIQIIKRLKKAQHEVQLSKLFDYVVVNSDVDQTVEQISKIILGNS